MFTMRALRLAGLLLLALTVAGCPTASPVEDPDDDDDETGDEAPIWPSEMQYLGDSAHTGAYPGPGPGGGFGEVTAEEIWSFAGVAESTPVVVDGRLFTVTWGGAVLALDAETGVLLWSRFDGADGDGMPPAQPAAKDGRLYVPSAGDGSDLWTDIRLFALDAATGETTWEFDAGDSVRAPVLVGDAVLVESHFSQDVHVLDGASGTQTALFDGPENARTAPPTFSVLWPRLVMRGHQGDGALVAFDLETGSELWAYVPSGPGDLADNWSFVHPLVADGVVVLLRAALEETDPEEDDAPAYNDRRLVLAHDLATGDRLWSNQAWEMDSWGITSLAASDGILVLGGFDPAAEPQWPYESSLLAWDLATGDQLWQAPDSEDLYGELAIVDGVVYGARGSGWGVCGYDLQTGERVAWIQVPGTICAAPVIAGGRLFVVTCDGVLRAFE